MRLVSEHVTNGAPGPAHPTVYATLSGVNLADIHRFTAGQPFADFARMRRQAPVMWHPEPRGHPGFWAVTRYADVQRVNQDPATFSSERGGILMALPPPELRANYLLFSASMNAMMFAAA